MLSTRWNPFGRAEWSALHREMNRLFDRLGGDGSQFDINSDKITANLKNGVLTIHLPKSEAVKPKKIVVRGKE